MTAAQDPAPQVSAAPASELRFYPSHRCGECHGRAEEEWSRSAHARAATAEFAQVIEKLAPDEARRCGACHRPLAAGDARVADEGVSCDACHTATGPANPPGVLVLAPEHATRYGPYRDANPHYFHKAAYSDFVVEGGLCAACHQDPPGRAVPEYTTVAEWQALPDRTDCQTCHMPGLHGPAARGEQVRNVSQHDFAPDRAKALAEALDLSVKVKGGTAEVTLTNSYADHDLPTGRPEQRLRLELQWLAEDGQPLAHKAQDFGRTLVDAAGRLVPSFAAVREAEDTRLRPGQRWTHRWPKVAGAKSLLVRLEYFRFDPALSDFFGPTEPVKVAEREEAL